MAVRNSQARRMTMISRKRPRASGGKDDKFRLASLQPDIDTRDLFAACMKHAERGEIVGAIVVPIYRRKPGQQLFSVHLAGTAAANPTYAAGVGASAGIIIRDLALKQSGLK